MVGLSDSYYIVIEPVVQMSLINLLTGIHDEDYDQPGWKLTASP
jgi:hypothetical protein